MATNPSPDDEPFQTVRRPIPSRRERREYGKSLRRTVPRLSLGDWRPADDRPDPVDMIRASHADRIPYLVPVRLERMLASPYGFLRGSANVCAFDCASLPSTGITAIICGDAHLGNFGFYGSPEGELVLDLNDFDEAHPGAWEWDLRRLVASVWVAGRQNRLTEQQCGDAAYTCVRAYQDELALLSETPLLARSFMKVDVNRLNETVSEPTLRDEVERAVTKARLRTSDRALPELTDWSGGSYRIIEAPPLVMRVSPERFDQVGTCLDAYLHTLPLQWRRVIGSYTLLDVAHKVVGVGSVGLRAFIALLGGSSPDDVLFLQLKEARRSVLARHVHGDRARHAHQGQRVVEYQQALQTVSDPLLGWADLPGLETPTTMRPFPGQTRSYHVPDVQVYVRQFRNMKGAVALDGLDSGALADYAGVLGLLLAKSHARTSGASRISGYLGRSDAAATALVRFAQAYADQTEADHAALRAAVADGRLSLDPEGR
ncbi:DUF2252 domain-containing protein [Brooklawnia cerclae]|uniref:DUF2252 domain-containing protein n=1 Tax=Brooklawnia cerclae TaxID=349934 RepID=A0ABX0SHC5_9ACTN|nr:DUF2252 domain-containing protein [Brooklawnia cerclae]NIH57793.1 hypothetical protein [Brooklawnia cerclae]